MSVWSEGVDWGQVKGEVHMHVTSTTVPTSLYPPLPLSSFSLLPLFLLSPSPLFLHSPSPPLLSLISLFNSSFPFLLLFSFPSPLPLLPPPISPSPLLPLSSFSSAQVHAADFTGAHRPWDPTENGRDV